MKRKRIYSAFMTFAMAIGSVVAYRLLVSSSSPFGIEARSDYEETLTAENGPGLGAEKNGMIDTDIITLYYSTNSELNDDSFVILSATDSKTPGVLMNLRVINGLYSVRVTFTGGPLYAIATKTIFEDFVPEAEDAITSDVPKSLGSAVNGYLLLMTYSTEDVTINEITVNFSCHNENDQNFVYDSAINYHVGARSWASEQYFEHDAIRFTTNPTETTNNYSTGTTNGHSNSWYRFCGVSLRNYAMVDETKVYDSTPKGEFSSNTFDIVVSVMIDPTIFYNPNGWFCVAPWISLATADHEILPDIGSYAYMQSYIGNDNFDPVGGLNAAGRTDTYSGRFITNYAANGGGYEWGFQNPDTTYVVDDLETTLREAYEAINLPFFNVRFSVNGNSYSVYINGFKVYQENNAFYSDENYTGQTYCIETMELQAVNYGDGIDLDAEGPDTISTPLSGYGVAYSNPLIIEPIV